MALFRVTVQPRKGEERIDEIEAHTPALAARMIEVRYPGGTVKRISRDWTIKGRCGNDDCHTYIFDGESYRHRNGQLRCADCA